MQPFTALACVLLGLVALAQLTRALLGRELVVAGVSCRHGPASSPPPSPDCSR